MRRALGPIVALSLVSAAAVPARAITAFTESLVLEHRAFDLPEGAPTMVVHAGPRFDPAQPFDLVVFLHGYSGCVNVLARRGRVACAPGGRTMTGWNLVAAHDRARANTILMMPQLAYLERDGSPGKLREPGYAVAMVREAFRGVRRLSGGATLAGVRHIVLVAHSGGFRAALTIVQQGHLGPRVRRIVLMDALYDGVSEFHEWLVGGPDRQVVSIHTNGRTREQTRRLVAMVRGAPGIRVAENPGNLRTAILRNAVVSKETSTPHARVANEYFDDVLGFRR